MKRFRLPFLLLLCLTVPVGLAQSLASLLPADTVFALGTEGLQDHQAQLQGFIDEFNRLGVGDALESVFASAQEDLAGDDADGTGDLEAGMPAELEGLGLLDVVGREAWLSVSMTSPNPIPSVTLVARLSPDARQAFASLIAESAGQDGVQALTEGDVTFYQENIDEGDIASAVAYGQDGDLLFASSNTDTLRSVLRRHQGSTEPSFTASAGYGATLATLGDGTVYSYLDLAPLADVANSLLAQQGFASAGGRVANALRTIGTIGSILRITSAGTESHSVQVLGDPALDPELYALLSHAEPAATDVLGFVPTNALAVQSGNLDLAGWWDYLTGLVESVPELGVSDVDAMLSSMSGLDLHALLFDWMGTHTGSITTGLGDAVQPGVPATNLLGEMVLLVQANDESAAAAGLSQLLSQGAAMVSSMTNPSGAASAAPPTTRQVAGVEVTDYAMGQGIEISTAVTGGYALIATSKDAMDAALTAKAAPAALPATLAAMQGAVPADARHFSLTDQQASLNASADQIASQIQLAAGLGGSAGIDFDAVEAASGTIEQFLHFVASKLGGSVTYGQATDGTITTTGTTQVAW